MADFPDGRSAVRRDPAFYPFAAAVETRFQDLDPLGHINNVAMAALFEQGRVRFNRDMLKELHSRGAGERWLIAKVDINYLAEGHFPAPVQVCTGIGRVGSSSWTLLAAAFQEDAAGNSHCIATCDCVLVMTGATGPMPIPDALRGMIIARMCAGIGTS
jgi:acyl-CoA thioester hydrolase